MKENKLNKIYGFKFSKLYDKVNASNILDNFHNIRF